jgi:hypothetical protein
MWNDWFINSEMSYTKSNNLKSPGYVNVIEWISTMWSEFDSDKIVKSFVNCGISNSDVDHLHGDLKRILLANPEVLEAALITIDDDDEELRNFDSFNSNDSNAFSLDMAALSLEEEQDEEEQDEEMPMTQQEINSYAKFVKEVKDSKSIEELLAEKELKKLSLAKKSISKTAAAADASGLEPNEASPLPTVTNGPDPSSTAASHR